MDKSCDVVEMGAHPLRSHCPPPPPPLQTRNAPTAPPHPHPHPPPPHTLSFHVLKMQLVFYVTGRSSATYLVIHIPHYQNLPKHHRSIQQLTPTFLAVDDWLFWMMDGILDAPMCVPMKML